MIFVMVSKTFSCRGHQVGLSYSYYKGELTYHQTLKVIIEFRFLDFSANLAFIDNSIVIEELYAFQNVNIY